MATARTAVRPSPARALDMHRHWHGATVKAPFRRVRSSGPPLAAVPSDRQRVRKIWVVAAALMIGLPLSAVCANGRLSMRVSPSIGFAPKTSAFEFQSLPGGRYAVRAVLRRQGGRGLAAAEMHVTLLEGPK